MIEKNKIIGPKTCAGGLTNLDKKIYIPKNKTRSFLEQTIFIENKQYIINLTKPIKTISRLDLGQYQTKKISNSKNIKILKETLVKNIKNNEVITSKGNFKFKYLVGADGSNSIVRKYLGLKSKICMGMYYNIPKITNNFIWHLDPKKIKSGYIWVFPHNKHTNIGVYFDPICVPAENAKKALQNFLCNNNYNFSDTVFEASPINYLYEGCVFNNIFLVGDAAGLASKTTGEGIAFAITSGREIGRKILCPEYNLAELKDIIKIKKRQERILRIFELFPSMQTNLFRVFVSLMNKKWFQSYFSN